MVIDEPTGRVWRLDQELCEVIVTQLDHRPANQGPVLGEKSSAGKPGRFLWSAQAAQAYCR